MDLKQLFTNDRNELSTTATIQMMSAITLCLGFIYALMFDKPAEDLLLQEWRHYRQHQKVL